jgi:hypothetical protein
MVIERHCRDQNMTQGEKEIPENGRTGDVNVTSGNTARRFSDQSPLIVSACRWSLPPWRRALLEKLIIA